MAEIVHNHKPGFEGRGRKCSLYGINYSRERLFCCQIPLEHFSWCGVVVLVSSMLAVSFGTSPPNIVLPVSEHILQKSDRVVSFAFPILD
jgi:hypothetical protein